MRRQTEARVHGAAICRLRAFLWERLHTVQSHFLKSKLFANKLQLICKHYMSSSALTT